MERRTAKEIEKDYKMIRKYVEANPSTHSFEEISKETNLTISQIHTSLSKHPRVFERIKILIYSNSEQFKAKKSAQKVTKQNENLDSPKSIFTSRKVDKPVKYVIDASITGIDSLRYILEDICNSKSKIVLTSVTIKELGKLQKFNSLDGKDARYILSLAISNPENSESVVIDESLDTPDNCIIKYCFDNKDDVTLLTSDKAMALSAKAYGVETLYFKQRKKAPVIKKSPMPSENMRINTLYAATVINGQLCINNFGNDSKQIVVISNGIEISEGTHKLKIGDDVYAATKKHDYLTFAHYKIISLDFENNCNLIFCKRFYDVQQINDLTNASYKSFMRDFKQKINA